MSSKLPINIEDLLRQRTVEGDRIEYKAGWNPDRTIQTISAFANDFENLGGGYVVIGQECDSAGQPIFPPSGVPLAQLDRIQQELLGYCNLIQPPYFPILSVEEVEGRNLIVLWAPGGQNRPYKVPRAVTAKQKEYHYYIRRYTSTIEARGEDQRELLSLTATVPFDDRLCRAAEIGDLRPSQLVAYLKQVGSDLAAEAPRLAPVALGRQMGLVDGGDELVKPRNVGLLFFNEEPRKFLPGAQIDVVIFPTGPAGAEYVEKTFAGPLQEQVRDALRYLQNNVLKEKVIKQPDRAEALRVANYPFSALEEALVNAVYHRSYEQREPVEVRVNPDGIDIISYPGPDASIRTEALNTGEIVARRYRNRRIGEFLKELKLAEGRCTGVPTIRRAMAVNGSPPPVFSTDEARTHFLVELPIHPDFAVEPGAHDGAHDEAHDEAHDGLSETAQAFLQALQVGPKNQAEIAQILNVKPRSGHLLRAFAELRKLELIELTIPEKPRSKNQKLRLTPAGKKWVSTQLKS